MKILLTGSNGQVGWELRRELESVGEIIAPCRDNLDLSQPETLREIILNIRPNLIVNAGAYTAVDKAEEERDLAFLVNSEAPRVLAQVSSELGALLVHYSTDYVFDGTGTAPFNEGDPVNPVNVYGASKAAGEAAIREICPNYFIFRTSWVYSQRGTNFFLTMQRLMRERAQLSIVNDQIGAPTWSRSIAQATAIILKQVVSCKEGTNLWGTYHMTSDGETSWFGFAKEILDAMEIEKKPQLFPIPSSEYLVPALRPLNSRLSNLKMKQNFGIRLPHWNDMFSEFVKSTFA